MFSEKDLDAIGAAGEPTLIFRNTEKTDSYAQASWIIEDQLVAGVRLECKVSCFENATIQETRFTQYPLTKGELTVVQNGGIVEKRPASEYQLPASSTNFSGDEELDLSKVEIRAAKEFPNNDQISGGKGDIVLGVEEIKVNDGVCEGADQFEFVLSLLNAGESTFMFTKLKIEAKMLNDENWTKMDDKAISWGYESPFPMTFASYQTGKFGGTVVVPFFDKSKDRPSSYRSHNAAHSPLRLRFTILDVKVIIELSFMF